MPGASWTDRSPTDWLASNGRWYAASKYPKGWSTSALPPAPGHGGVGSILRQFVDSAVSAVPKGSAMFDGDDDRFADEFIDDEYDEYDDDSSDADGPTAGWTVGDTGRTAAGTAVVRTGRQVADATISEPPVGALRAPAPRAPALPAPPGRIRPEMPAPPDARSQPPAPAPAPAQPPAPSGQTGQAGSFDVVAGDLGKVLGSAKRRIERAINEAAEQ